MAAAQERDHQYHKLDHALWLCIKSVQAYAFVVVRCNVITSSIIVGIMNISLADLNTISSMFMITTTIMNAAIALTTHAHALACTSKS